MRIITKECDIFQKYLQSIKVDFNINIIIEI